MHVDCYSIILKYTYKRQTIVLAINCLYISSEVFGVCENIYHIQIVIGTYNFHLMLTYSCTEHVFLYTVFGSK